jgi:2-dehydropantoate 2-reductase
METPAPRILVSGCGAIGGIILGGLLEQGRRVSCVAKRPEIAQALKTRGVKVRDEHSERTIAGELEVFTEVPKEGAYDYILLAMQPDAVEEAARAAADRLAPNGAMVCLQNGLIEERVGKIVGRERVIGAIVAWGASSSEPGVYDRTSSGGFVLGTLDGAVDERVLNLARALEAIGPAETTTNLRGARFSKLAVNCAISSIGTVGAQRLGSLLVHRFVRRLALEVMTEAVEVARAEKLELEKVSGTLDLEWIALTEAEKISTGSPSLVAKHGLLLAVGARYRRLRSSMLAAIERGRAPSVDFLNGEIVDRAKKHGLSVPVNERLQQAVHQISRGQLERGLPSLRELFEQTR